MLSSILRFFAAGALLVVSLCHCTHPRAPEYFPEAVLDYVHRDTVNAVFRRADSLKYRQQYDQAARAFTEILNESLSPNDRFYALNQLALTQLMCRQDASARLTLSACQTLRKILPAPDPFTEADYCFNEGLLASHAHEPDSARYYLDKAGRSYQSLYPGRHLKKARCLNAVASLQIDYALHYNSVVSAILRAEDAFQAPALEPYQKECLLNQAFLARTRRNYSLGEALCDRALALAQAKGIWPDTLFWAECYSEKGSLLLKKAQAAKQRQPFETSKACLDRAIQFSECFPKEIRRQYFYQNLLLYYIENTAAHPQFFQQLEGLRALLRRQGRDVYGLPDRLEGYWALVRGDSKRVIDCYSRAAQQIVPGRPHYWQLSDELNYALSDAYFASGRLDEALYCKLEMFKAGTPLAGRNLSEDDLMRPEYYSQVTNPFVPFSHIAAVYLARYQRDGVAADLSRANRFYALADSLMTADLLKKVEGQILTFQEEVGNDNYANAVHAAYLWYQKSQDKRAIDLAFRYMERQKSLVLYQDLLAHSRDNLPGWKMLMDSLSAVERTLRDLEWMQSIGENAEGRALHARGLLEAQQKRQAVLEQCHRDYPDLADTLNLQTVPSVDAVVAALSDSQTVLQYSLRDTVLGFALCISKKGTHFVKLNPARLVEQVSSCRKALSRRSGALQSTQTTYKTTARSLYDILVKPFESLMPAQGGTLIVIPDGILHQLPFDALLLQDYGKVGQSFYKNAPYLGRKWAVSVSPAWKIRMHQPPSDAPYHEVLAYAYGDVPSDLALLGWKTELQGIRQAGFDLATRTGTRCTARSFLKEAFQREIVHVSLHGHSSTRARNDNKLFFGIAPMPVGQDSLVDVLYGFQIGAQAAKTRLAVLSACETALGEHESAEGAYTLVRSFLQAGVSEIIASVWAIDDGASASLMGAFYTQLHRRGTAAEALYRAKLEYLNAASPDECFPGFWAGICAFN